MNREIKWIKGEANGGKPITSKTMRSGASILYIHKDGGIHTAKVATCMVDMNKPGCDLLDPKTGEWPHPLHHYPSGILWWAKIGKDQKP